MEVEVEEGVEETDNADDSAGSGVGRTPSASSLPPATGAAGATGGGDSDEPMEVDEAFLNVSAVLNAANEVAAQMNVGAGAETEVERDVVPSSSSRRAVESVATLRSGNAGGTVISRMRPSSNNNNNNNNTQVRSGM